MTFFGFRLPKVRVDWEEPPASAPLPKTDIQVSLSDDRPDNAPEEPTKIKKKYSFIGNFFGFSRPQQEKRPILIRLLGVRFGQFINLFIWCVLAGVIMNLTNFNPLQPQFDASETADNALRQGLNALGWALRHSWQPALTGAAIILPLWLIWRLLTLPFRH